MLGAPCLRGRPISFLGACSRAAALQGLSFSSRSLIFVSAPRLRPLGLLLAKFTGDQCYNCQPVASSKYIVRTLADSDTGGQGISFHYENPP